MKAYRINRIYYVFSKAFWKLLGFVLPCELLIVIWAIARSSFTVEFFGVCNFEQVCRDLRAAFPQAEHIQL